MSPRIGRALLDLGRRLLPATVALAAASVVLVVVDVPKKPRPVPGQRTTKI
jgi:hypothetical protein